MEELDRMKKKYDDKAKPYTELEEDAGGLGKTGAGYQERQRAGHGLHNPRGGMAEASSQYDRKARAKYTGEEK